MACSNSKAISSRALTFGSLPTLRNSTMQKAVIHAGFRKVGSTTIQEGLRLNQELLSPTHHLCIRDDIARPMRKAVRLCARRSTWRSRRAIDTAISQTVSRLKADSKGRTIVLSDENLFGSFCYLENGDTLIDWAVIVLPKLEAALRRKNIEPHFIVYTRHLADWYKSAWNQSVRQKGFGGTLEEWTSGMPADFSWDVEIQRLQDALSAPLQHVDLKNESSTAPFLGYAVLEAAGVAPDVLARVKQSDPKNVSPPFGATKLLQMLNSADPKNARPNDMIKRETLNKLITANPQLFARSPQT